MPVGGGGAAKQCVPAGGQDCGCSPLAKALQLSTKRVVALKVTLGGPFASASAKRRFEREVELAARLQHPHIVRVLEAGEVYLFDRNNDFRFLLNDNLYTNTFPDPDTDRIVRYREMLRSRSKDVECYAEATDEVRSQLKGFGYL